jgi:glutamyl-tRNA reductase
LEKDTAHILVVGVSHHTADLDLRQRIAFDPANLDKHLRDLSSRSFVSEAAILSTCNRSEVYCCASSDEGVIGWLSQIFNVDESDLIPHLYIHRDLEAARHAIRVASGLDSMVVGETQIFGQIKDAYRRAKSLEALGVTMHQMFQTAFSVAKEVRGSTEISRYSVSLSAAAVRASKQIFSELDQPSILFVGAGEMIRISADHFFGGGYRELAFTNRTIARAAELANQYGGETFDIGELSRNLSFFDVIVSCTASPFPIIGKGAFEAALKKRKHRPMVVFDLAVPRDIEAQVASLDDIFLYSIDDLGELVKLGLENRREAIVAAEPIIQKGIKNFSRWLESREILPVLRAYRSLGQQIVEAEYERALLSLKAEKSPEEVLRMMSFAIEQKILDRPSRALNRAEGNRKKILADSLISLFDLE